MAQRALKVEPHHRGHMCPPSPPPFSDPSPSPFPPTLVHGRCVRGCPSAMAARSTSSKWLGSLWRNTWRYERGREGGQARGG